MVAKYSQKDSQKKRSLNDLERVIDILKKHKNHLKKKYNIKEIYIFGSYVRKESKEKSDIDLLVEFSKPIGLLKFIELEDYLTALLGKKVDLVSINALKKHIGKNVMKEKVKI